MAALALGATVNEIPPDEVGPGQMMATGMATYAFMVAAAVGWLGYRERLDQLPEQALGCHGPWLAAGVGLGAGLLMFAGLAWLSKRLQVLRELDAMVAKTFRASSEATTLAFVLCGAIAEELLFRLAAQDALGLFGSVALYSLLYSSFGGWRWLLFMAPHALLLGLLMHFGFGLLASTTANAIMNHLNLRRLRC